MFKLTPKPIREKIAHLIEAIPYELRETSKAIATFDTETDPFEYGVAVLPFTCCLALLDSAVPLPDRDAFDYVTVGDKCFAYKEFWGDDCIEQYFDWIGDLEGEYLIYTHNGGNFDFYFMLDFIDRGSAPFIINGRLAKLFMQGQEYRDSYALIPVALATYQKTEIDYENFKRPIRDKYKSDILSYQRDDCFFLYDLVTEAHTMFGDKLTMASIALPMLRSFHGFEAMRESVDADMRPYYFGGRCECFEVGELKGDWKIYDVNSMYPHVMADCLHPISSQPRFGDRIDDRTDFAFIRAFSDGALPVRGENGSLSFPTGNGDYYASIHEINAGLETGTLRISKVYRTVHFDQKTSFANFVNHFYNMRLEAKAKGDKIRLLYYKLVLNSSYGKLAQDPRRYENYNFDPEKMPRPLRCNECTQEQPKNERCIECREGFTSPNGWYPHTIRGNEIIYARPSTYLAARGFYNVATAASITGAARAYLLRGIRSASRPIYVDTDSIVCERLEQELDDSKLGAWKLEATGDTACIAGKKLYAIFNGNEPIKHASKGVKLSPQEIARVCAGETLEYSHPVPKFKLNGDIEFTQRNIRTTGNL